MTRRKRRCFKRISSKIPAIWPRFNMGVLPAGTLKLPSAMLAAIERAARLSWSSFALKWLNDQKDDEWRSVIIRRVGEVVTEEHTGGSSLPVSNAAIVLLMILKRTEHENDLGVTRLALRCE